MANTTYKDQSKQTGPSKSSTNSNQPSRVRAVFAGLFGFLALNLILTSLLVVWLNRTLTNTDAYVKAVGPLASKQEVQDFVITKVSDTLLGLNKDQSGQQMQQDGNQQNNQGNNQPGNNQKQQDNGGGDGPSVRDIAGQLLPAEMVAGKTESQLIDLVQPIIKESLSRILASEKFATLWTNTNREVHKQLIKQLESNDPTLNLNLHPVVVAVVDELGTTKLAVIRDKLLEGKEIGADVGLIKISGTQLSQARKVYGFFKAGTIALVASAALAVAISVLISNRRLNTLRRITLLTGIFAGLYALGLTSASLVSPGGMSEVDRNMAVAVLGTLTHDLRTYLIVISVTAIVLALVSKLYSVWQSKKV